MGRFILYQCRMKSMLRELERGDGVKAEDKLLIIIDDLVSDYGEVCGSFIICRHCGVRQLNGVGSHHDNCLIRRSKMIVEASASDEHKKLLDELIYDNGEYSEEFQEGF